MEGNAQKDSNRLFLNSTLFSSGWFTLSFIFPLLLLREGYSYETIGILGMATSVPFPVIAGIYLYSSRRMIRFGIIMPALFLAVMSFSLIFFYSRFLLFLAIISGIIQAPWWISTEINLNSLESNRNAEKYSIGWGLPNAAIPIIMGFLLEFSHVYVLLLITAVFFSLATLFSPPNGAKTRIIRKSRVELRFSLALLFTGMFSGFLYYLLEPLMRDSGFSYGLIGIIIAIYGISSAVSYISLHYMPDLKLRSYSIISAILVAPAGLLGFYFQVPAIVLVVVLGGLGVALSMSKILSYLITLYPPRKGVFFYETFFGLGFIVGSYGIDTSLEYLGRPVILVITISSVAYALYLALDGLKERSVTVASGNSQ